MTPPAIIPDALILLDYVGIGVFAVSGALLAAEKKQTLVTFIFFAVATGIGGGRRDDRSSGHRGTGGVCLAWPRNRSRLVAARLS